MASMCIFFYGIGIAYKKDDLLWHVLFPFNNCHNVNFSYQVEDEDPSDWIPLGKPNTEVKITNTFIHNVADATQNFKNFVLDLTASGLHEKINRNNNLFDHGVLLTIEKALFFVRGKYLQDFPQVKNFDVILKYNDVPKPLGLLAHTVGARIEIDDNHIFQVKINDEEIITGDKGVSYKLWFDNDCRKAEATEDRRILKSPSDSDFKMFYTLFSDGKKPEKKFEIEGIPKGAGSLPEHEEDDIGCIDKPEHILTGEPDLVNNKPCMFVQIGKPGDLP